MKKLFLICVLFLSLSAIAQIDTLHYKGSIIVENKDEGQVFTNVEISPILKLYKNSSKSAYLYLRIGDNTPVVDGLVDIIMETNGESGTTLGFVSSTSGPFMLRIYSNNTATFHFEPDYETEVMKSYIIMSKL